MKLNVLIHLLTIILLYYTVTINDFGINEFIVISVIPKFDITSSNISNKHALTSSCDVDVVIFNILSL